MRVFVVLQSAIGVISLSLDLMTNPYVVGIVLTNRFSLRYLLLVFTLVLKLFHLVKRNNRTLNSDTPIFVTNV
jgi:hypothetical protein